MEIGDPVLHDGETFIFRGYNRMSLEDEQFVSIEDPESGEWRTVPWADVKPLA